MDADASIPGLDLTGSVEDFSQFAESEFDEIYLSHVLEHVPHAQVPGVLVGLHRILNEGGTLRISVPDSIASAVSTWTTSTGSRRRTTRGLASCTADR